jgi:ABC-2 type transport system ATP-binding protein
MGSEPVIKVKDLVKRYSGGVTIGPISIETMRGEILGLVGPNGSGKTTTIRCLVGLQRPTGGEVRVAGLDPLRDRKRLMRLVGYSQELPAFPPFQSGRDIIETTGRLRGLDGPELRKEVERVLDLSGLVGHADRKVGSYSKGMVQRLSLAQALIGDPEILILDEPMLGVDPAARIHMREVFLELKRARKTILFSTHELYEVEKISDRVAMIYRGKIIVQDSVKNLLGGVGDTLRVEVELQRPQLAPIEQIRLLRGVSGVELDGTRLVVEFAGGIDGRAELAELIARSGAGLLGMTPQHKTLEDIFMEMVRVGSRS